MPIIKSAKKRVKQTKVRQARNYNVRSALKKAIRQVEDAVKAEKKAEAEKLLVVAYKIIDTAEKKGILHVNTSARRKSVLANMVNEIGKKKATSEKVEPEKKGKEKKEEPKAEDVKTEEAAEAAKDPTEQSKA